LVAAFADSIMPIRSAIAKSTMVGFACVLAALTLLLVLLVGAVIAQTLAAGTTMPAGADPATFFFGGAWIDLTVVIVLAFTSGFLLTFRRLHGARRAAA
jgi:uncharacterized BrkB/YihY/UPF0761 family membrane protein